MNRLKPHLALLVCNVLWAMDYPFYNIVLPHYVHPMAMVSASLVATALFSLVPLLWQKAEKVERADIRKLIGAALLIGVLRKVFIMYGLSMTSPIDGSIIDTIVPLLVLALSVSEVTRGRHKNFMIFAESTKLFWQQIAPYGANWPPAEFPVRLDYFLYGPLFNILFAPFAYLPAWLGPIVWNVFNFTLWFAAIFTLPGKFTREEKCKSFLFTFLILA